jgi:uncharacterized protein YbcI
MVVPATAGAAGVVGGRRLELRSLSFWVSWLGMTEGTGGLMATVEGEPSAQHDSRGQVQHDGRGQVAGKISKAIAALQRSHYGRGAGRARTIMHGDFVVCFLEDIYMPVERTLIDAGQFEQVRATRQAFQDALEPEYRAIVEEHTGRKVAVFFSQVSHDPDMALEGFALVPVES